jgi:hypothetical protein
LILYSLQKAQELPRKDLDVVSALDLVRPVVKATRVNGLEVVVA